MKMIKYEVKQVSRFEVVEVIDNAYTGSNRCVGAYDSAETAQAVADALSAQFPDHPADSVINEMDEAEAILNDDTPFPGCVPISAMDESGTTIAEANGADKDEFDQFFG